MNDHSTLDIVWVLIATTLVFIMQAGFMCLECGNSRAKNTINVAIKNITDFCLAVILFWVVGFGLMFGRSIRGWMGTDLFLIDAGQSTTVIFFLFQAVFVGTAATICSGAIAERMKFASYLIISVITSVLIYPIFGHWAWGGGVYPDQQGWLQAMGFKDFAGSTVVHSVGGWVALASAMVVGPRVGKYSEDGTVNKIQPHNITLFYLGVFILFFGWFGFNCGSTLKASPDIAIIALNTILSASFGCVSAGALSWIFHEEGVLAAEDLGNGLLAGLVGITAGCAFVETTSAMFIGVASGTLYYFSNHFIERVLKVDDVVGAVAVHAVCGVWGTIAVGLFIMPEMLGGISRVNQVTVQVIGAISCFLWAFGIGFILIKAFDFLSGGMRVDRDAEIIGLNVAEHGASSSVLDLVNAMHRSAREGNFANATKVEVEFGTEIGDLAQGYNQMVEAIQQSFSETERQAHLAEQARRQAEAAYSEVDRQRIEAEDQARYISSISERLTAEVKEIRTAMSMISGSADHVQNSVMDLKKQAEAIQNILSTINEIAITSKMLSLNASIEAANSMDTNNRFGVVADSMLSLAGQTRQATVNTLNISSGLEDRLEKVLTDVDTQCTSVLKGTETIKRVGELIRQLVLGKDRDAPLQTART